MEEGRVKGQGRLSVYNRQTKLLRVLAADLQETRGLQVTPKLEVIYMGRRAADDQHFQVWSLDASVALSTPPVEGCVPAPRVLLTLVEKDRFGYAMR